MKIKTFEATLTGKISHNEIEEVTYKVPRAKQRNSGRKYESKNRTAHGPYWERVFFENELAAFNRAAKCNSVLQQEFLAAHRNDQRLKFRFASYKQTIGMYRREYNKQKLYQAQSRPLLVSFQYDETSIIVIGGKYPTTYMYFEDCYQRCVSLRVADPRFIPHEYIVKIRDRQNEGDPDWLDWIVPNEVEIKKLCTLAGVKELYNSIKFPSGWTREETPNDYEPIPEDV